MNEFQWLVAEVAGQFPHARLVAESGKWLEIHVGDSMAVIEWRPAQGFGMSLLNQVADPMDGFGEGPQEIFAERRALLARLAELMPQPAETTD